jgi:pimeloyl-ACP methyl ester carboxylesterase
VVERTVSQLIADITDRVGRKAVLIAHSTGMPLVVRAAGVHRERVSDVVILEAPHKLIADDVRIHFISSGWFMLRTMIELPRLLGSILKRKGTDVTTIAPEATIKRAADWLRAKNIGALVVTSGNAVLG